MNRYYVFIFIIFAAFTLSKGAFAESPCTYLGHERLEHASACINQSGGASSNARYMNNHHIQMVNGLQNDRSIPAHSYPHVGDQIFYSHMINAAAIAAGPMYGFPRYRYYWYYLPTSLPTDIIDYIE